MLNKQNEIFEIRIFSHFFTFVHFYLIQFYSHGINFPENTPAPVPETEKVRHYDAHHGKLGVVAIFTESSEISAKKILFGRKLIFWQHVKNSLILCLNHPYFCIFVLISIFPEHLFRKAPSGDCLWFLWFENYSFHRKVRGCLLIKVLA